MDRLRSKERGLDDVSFKNYRETVDPNSPHIVLLSPADSPSPYYVETGFIADPGSNLVLPGHDTLWQADRETLTESSPVTLTYDNGQGLVFHRKIAIDDRYMFTVTDSVENKSAQPVSIHPFAFVKRHGKGRVRRLFGPARRICRSDRRFRRPANKV